MEKMHCSSAAGLIPPKDCALLIVDVQEKLLPWIQGQEQVRKNIVRIARFASLMNVPLVVCEQVKLGQTVSDIAREMPEVQPIEKETFNCFAAKAFRDQLSALRKKYLVICGIEAHVCVLQTALSGQQEHGYQVQVLMDATASRTPDNLQLARERFQQTGVGLSSTEMFIFEVLQRAGTEQFKATLPLIK